MNYTTLLKDPHNRQVVKAIIWLATPNSGTINNTIDKADLLAKSNKSVSFVEKVVNTFVNLNQCTVKYTAFESIASVDRFITSLTKNKTEYVFKAGVITDLIAGLKELGFSPE